MKRILCATDGSPSAQNAVEYAIELAHQLKAELTFIHVMVPRDGDINHSYFWDSNILQAAEHAI